MKNNPVQGVCWPGLAWRILRFVQGTMDPPGGAQFIPRNTLARQLKMQNALEMHNWHPKASFLQLSICFSRTIKLAVDTIDAPPINKTQRLHLPEEKKKFLWHIGLSARVFMNECVMRGR